MVTTSMKKEMVKTSVSFPEKVLQRGKEKARRDGFGNSFSAYLAKLVGDDLAKAKQS